MRNFFVLLCLFLIASVSAAEKPGKPEKPGKKPKLPNYKNCRISVVGAGWSGAYFAWKLTVSNESKYNPNEVCIFEQSNTHLGGRVYTYGHPSWEDLTVDLGAYRYQTSQELVKGVIESILQYPTICYNGPCTDTTGYRIISDPYSNNGGYSKGITGLIDQYVQAGGDPVYTGHKLVNIQKNTGARKKHRPIKLVFENGVEVISEKVFLNIPGSAIDALDHNNNILFTQGTNYSIAALKSGSDAEALKQFIWYDDAWWLTKLNLTEGDASVWGSLPAINTLRYGDGAVKCYTTLPNGTRQYSPVRVPGGTCYGILMTTYLSFDDATYDWYYDNWVTPEEKATGQLAIYIKRGDSREALLDEMHTQLMNYYNQSLWDAGVDPSTITPPNNTILGFWSSEHNVYTPSFYTEWHDFMSDTITPDAQFSLRNIVAKPLVDYDIFIASEAYSVSGAGWAEGSLILAERILASHFGFHKPSYVSYSYYNSMVTPYAPKTHTCLVDTDCKSPNNCVTGKCESGKCEWSTRTQESCFQDDLCNVNTTCSYTAMCYGPPVTCSTPTDICVAGNCVPPVVPSLPACSYSNPVGGFTLNWEFIGTTAIRFAFSLPGGGYQAFGIGNSMVNSDIVVGSLLGDGSIVVKDYWAYTPGPPYLDTNLGGTNDLTDVWAAAGGWWGAPVTIWFTRQLNTGDSYDQVIVNGTMNFIYAWSPDTPAGGIIYHGENKNKFTLDLSQCT